MITLSPATRVVFLSIGPLSFDALMTTVVTVGTVVSMTGSGVLSMSRILPLWANGLPATSWMPAIKAAFSLSSSTMAWPFWPEAIL